VVAISAPRFYVLLARSLLQILTDSPLAPQFIWIYPKGNQKVHLHQTKAHTLKLSKRSSVLQIAGRPRKLEVWSEKARSVERVRVANSFSERMSENRISPSPPNHIKPLQHLSEKSALRTQLRV